LTHREEIRLQTVEKLAQFGLQPGQIASGRPLTDNPVQVASIQTLVNQLDTYKYAGYKPDVIIVDEAHHAVAETWVRILNYWPDCLNLGWTATPRRLDGIGLGHIYDDLNEGPQTHELVDKEYLCEPVVFSSPLSLEIAKIPFKIVNNDYSVKEQTVFMSQKYIVQDTIECYSKFFNGAPIIIFCISVADCHLVSETMIKAGWRSGVVESGMDPDLRKKYIMGLANGSYNVVCSYEVLGEGVDIPVLAGIIIRRRTSSLAMFLQWCGRPVRTAEGKKYGIIIDQAANYFIHGHPLDHQTWSLDDSSQTTSASVSVRTCPNNECLAVLKGNPSECPYCGCNLKEKKDTVKDLPLKIVNAELLKVQMPQYTIPDSVTEEDNESDQDELLNRIIAESLPNETQKHDLESRLRMMDTMLLQNKHTKKAWRNYLRRTGGKT